jgi:hypothetical protein
MRTELTLYLKPDPESNAPAREIADQLIALGGWMTGWEADTSCSLGCATFVFADETDCNRFLRAALRVPGVYRERDELQPLPRTSSSAFEVSEALSRIARL